jgi:ankyrin repeat protein
MAEIATLFELAKSGDVEKVRELLALEPALASHRLPGGESPLMAALYRGHLGVVDALIEAGAHLDVFAAAATGRLAELRRAMSPETVNTYAYDGWTPLHLAAFFGQLEAAKVLLDAGANVRAVSSNSLKNTPLHAATAGKHAAVALALIAHGADPTVVDAGGYTPLRIAQENELAGVVAAISPDRH